VLCIFCSGIDFVSLQSLFAVSRVYNNNSNNKHIYILPYGRDFRGGGSTGKLMQLLGVIVFRVKQVGFESGLWT